MLDVSNVTIEEDVMYITHFLKELNTIKNIYIYLENVFCNTFYDIYSNDIENKSVNAEEYERVIGRMLTTNNIKYIYLIDSKEVIQYYMDVSDTEKIEKFSNAIASVVF